MTSRDKQGDGGGNGENSGLDCYNVWGKDTGS